MASSNHDVDLWLAANNPRLKALLPLDRGDQYRAFAALASSGVAAVPSAATVSGKLGQVASAEANKAMAAAGSDVKELTAVLIKNPIAGCTSVMDIALRRSGYNPLDPVQAGNYSSYLAYVTEIVKAPFFHLNYADQKTLHQSSSDWDKLINSAVELFDGIIAEDKDRIVKGLQQLAHSATATSDTEQKLNVFSQQAISVNTNVISVGIYYSSVSMIEHNGKHTTKQSDFVVNRAFLNFRLDEWPSWAGKVAATQTASVDDWLSGNNSVKG